MAIGIIETIRKTLRVGVAMHPGLTINSLKHHVILFVHSLRALRDIRKWYGIPDNPLLAMAIKRFPLMDGMVYWPYINYTWSMEQRLAIIDRHFRMLEGPAAIVAYATFKDIELARIDEYPGLRLVLDKTVWLLREGEIVLNLFINDKRFYSIAFTLGMDSHQTVAYVGGLQGSNDESALDVYRDITHSLHGMRPRDFLMIAFKLLCGELGIEKIWAVSNEKRQHNSPYFGGDLQQKVLVDYDEIWVEHGGIDLGNGFFEIPVSARRKEMADIPSKKRATYRRRYQMLDRLKLEIAANCASYAAHPAATLPPAA
jgi:uncharacterized protein VirK/YbjX